MGFEALLWGKPVRCFGLPFYAGWGLTEDRISSPVRRKKGASLEALVHACLIESVRCIDPHRRASCQIEELMQAIGLQRRLQQQAPERVDAFGFTPWKQRNLRRFLAGSDLRFRRSGRQPGVSTTAVAIWGRRGQPSVLESARVRNLPLLHVEDGFLRSVGLGAELIDPISWVVDRSGCITTPHVQAIWNAFWRENPGLRLSCPVPPRCASVWCWKRSRNTTFLPSAGSDEHQQRVVLVVGQVESDASIQFGAPGIKTNLALLQAVRVAEPDAYLVYKPHPDVMAGLCRAGEGEDGAAEVCDEVLTGGAKCNRCFLKSTRSMCSRPWQALRRCFGEWRCIAGDCRFMRAGDSPSIVSTRPGDVAT